LLAFLEEIRDLDGLALRGHALAAAADTASATTSAAAIETGGIAAWCALLEVGGAVGGANFGLAVLALLDCVVLFGFAFGVAVAVVLGLVLLDGFLFVDLFDGLG